MVLKTSCTPLQALSLQWHVKLHPALCHLQGISGDVQPGTLCALMGPSGAGKSTLMDILAARKTVGDIKGQVLVNGAPRKDSTFTKMAAYVPQVSKLAGRRLRA